MGKRGWHGCAWAVFSPLAGATERKARGGMQSWLFLNDHVRESSRSTPRHAGVVGKRRIPTRGCPVSLIGGKEQERVARGTMEGAVIRACLRMEGGAPGTNTCMEGTSDCFPPCGKNRVLLTWLRLTEDINKGSPPKKCRNVSRALVHYLLFPFRWVQYV